MKKKQKLKKSYPLKKGIGSEKVAFGAQRGHKGSGAPVSLSSRRSFQLNASWKLWLVVRLMMPLPLLRNSLR